MSTVWRATFTGTSGTNVFTSYTPEVGTFDSSLTLGGTFVVELDGSGNARVQGAAAGVAGQLFILTTGGPANFSTTLNFTPGVAGNSSINALTWKDDGGGNFYALYCAEGTTGLTMIRAAAFATAATLGTYNTGFSAGTPMLIQLVVEGTKSTVSVNGAFAFTATDANLTTTNRQSLTFNDSNTVAANRTQLSDVTIDDSVPLLFARTEGTQETLQPWYLDDSDTAQAPIASDAVPTPPLQAADDTASPWAPFVLDDSDTVSGVLSDDLNGNITLTLTGVSSAGAVGTVVPQVSITQTGVSSAGAVGTVVPQVTQGVTGVSSAGAIGTVVPQVTQAVTGVSSAGAVGTVTPTVALTAANTSSAGAIGTVAPAVSLTAASVSSAGAVGTVSLSISASVTLTGVSSAGAVGTLSPVVLPTMTGVASPGAIGTLALTASLTSASVSSAGAVGTVTPVVIPSITGVSSAGAIGTVGVTVGGNITLTLTGVSSAGAVGAVTPTVALTTSNTSSAGAIGTVVPQVSVVLLSVSGLGQVGVVGLSYSRTLTLTGVYSQGAVGSIAFTAIAPRLGVGASVLRLPQAPTQYSASDHTDVRRALMTANDQLRAQIASLDSRLLALGG